MITLMSWGFKFSRPEANIVFDVSYFKNPWRDEELKTIKKGDKVKKTKILEFMAKQKGVYQFCQNIADVAKQYDSLFPDENVVIALCCSSGEYRSPALVEFVNKLLPKEIKRTIIQSKNSRI